LEIEQAITQKLKLDLNERDVKIQTLQTKLAAKEQQYIDLETRYQKDMAGVGDLA
jgi:hypothetical protein